MSSRFIIDAPLPFCGGCGHGLVVRNTARALETLGLEPLDVILVTDIGCHGIIDRHFRTHTVHGLHGRAIALAAGIAACQPDTKKVIAYLGDGGAIIGLQHLIEAAHRNFPVTAILHNNLLYGMTGGQPSGLTPCGFRTPTCPDGHKLRGYDIVQRVHSAGAASACRVIGRGDFSPAIVEALTTPGFALVEVVELCPSYGVKHNPGRSLDELVRAAGLELGRLTGPTLERYRLHPRAGLGSLLDMQPVMPRERAALTGSVSILLGGSAGEGVQVAAELFCRAAMAAGLHVAKRGAYPVTVSTGYSVADIVLSPEPILYAGAIVPDYVVITSADGLAYYADAIGQLKSGTLIIDRSLSVPQTGAQVITADIRGVAGPRAAALRGLARLLQQHQLFPLPALVEEIRTSRLGSKLNVERITAIEDDSSNQKETA